MTQFEQVIKEYLDKRASEDEQFAKSYAKENKSIEECCKFIMAEVCDLIATKSGAQSYGMNDDEVYGLAVHYYDDDNIQIKPLKAKSEVLKTNITYTPTEEEKRAAKEEALKKLQEDAYRELQGKQKVKAVTEQQKQEQMSLF